jgi:hypothetical protein
MPATAAKPRTMTSARYPGWAISQIGATDYLMSRPNGIFAIGVGHSDEHGWTGELLTRQRGGWVPAKTPFRHSVIGCITEVERREKQIAKFASKPLGKPTTK